MDPNANLEELRRIVTELSDPEFLMRYVERDPAGVAADVTRLAELCAALDGWLSKGGFLPRDWEPGTEARRLIPGERIPTTTGTREVITVDVDNARQRVLVTVADPAGKPPDFVTTIGYALGQRVRVITEKP